MRMQVEKNAQDALHAEALQAAPEEAKARAEEAKAKAEIEVAKEQRKAEVKVARQHRKELESQLKHEKEMRLLQEDPEAYKAYLEREQQEKTEKRNLIKKGVLIYIAIAVVAAIIMSFLV